MLQNPCKTLGFKKNMVYKIPPGEGGEVNHIQPVAYICKISTELRSFLSPGQKLVHSITLIPFEIF